VDTLVWVLLESTVTLAVILALVSFFLLVYWRRSGRPRPLLIGLAVAFVLLGLQALIVTKREHAAATLSRIETDLLASRVEALDRALAADFQAGHMNHESFVDFARRQLKVVEIHWLRRTSPRVEQSQKDSFRISVGYTADVTAHGYVGPVGSRWTITFVREGGGWRIGRIDPPMINRQQFNDWHDFRRW
jgi:hypothetical protein